MYKKNLILMCFCFAPLCNASSAGTPQTNAPDHQLIGTAQQLALLFGVGAHDPQGQHLLAMSQNLALPFAVRLEAGHQLIAHIGRGPHARAASGAS